MELKVYGHGLVAKDAVVVNTSDGKQVAFSNVGFDESYKVGEEWKVRYTNINVAAWDKKSARFAELAKKGKRLFIVGKLSSDKNGDPCISLDTVEECVKFVRKDTQQAPVAPVAKPVAKPVVKPAPVPVAASEPEQTDDTNMPF